MLERRPAPITSSPLVEALAAALREIEEAERAVAERRRVTIHLVEEEGDGNEGR